MCRKIAVYLWRWLGITLSHSVCKRTGGNMPSSIIIILGEGIKFCIIFYSSSYILKFTYSNHPSYKFLHSNHRTIPWRIHMRYGWMDYKWVNEWMDVDGWMDGWMDGWIDGCWCWCDGVSVGNKEYYKSLLIKSFSHFSTPLHCTAINCYYLMI